jgi:maltooligosyltrehalose trehalohydrolase
MFGERLGTLVPFEALKLASAAVLTAPAIPLLFMGEEYGETAPFLYFINHGDPKLVTAVRQGRKGEFSAFSWKGEPPDPQDDSTFLESKLQWHRLSADNHSVLHSWYKRLLALRREYPPLHIINRAQCTTWVDKEKDLFFARRITKTQSVEILMNWSANTVSTIVPAGFEGDTLLIDSADQLWNGPPLTSAPAQISSGQTIVLQPYHIAIYI